MKTIRSSDSDPPMKNWAGNYEFTAARVHEPRRVEDVRDIVRSAKTLRVVGTRHSFNDIADCTNGALLSTAHLDRIVSIDADSVTVEGGITYGKLALELHRAGVALPHMATLPHIPGPGP